MFYWPYLIPFIPGPRRRQSLFSVPNSRNEGESRDDEENKQEGRLAFNAVNTFIDYGQGAEYGDTSATYWNLYLSEAEINDKNFVESLEGDTNSMVLVVSPSALPTEFRFDFLLSASEHFILFYRRVIYYWDL